MNYLNAIQNWFSTPINAILASSTLLVLVGVRLYCRGGVCRADRDLSGKVVVITGANTGIGKETIRELSRKGCRIFFGARDGRKAEEAIKQIMSENPKADLTYIPLDLADKASIREFAARVNDEVRSIDILINNAAVMALPERKLTADGFEMQMGTNHYGHFYLTSLLWGSIAKTNEFRVINVSSRAHRGFGYPKYDLKIDFEDMALTKNYQPGDAYGRSKAANILFAKEMQRRVDEAGLNGVCVSLHPGVVRTELMRYFSWKAQAMRAILSPLVYLLMKSPLEGAQTTLHLALADLSKINKGGYYEDCALKPSSTFTTSMENARQLWEVSEKDLAIQFKI